MRAAVRVNEPPLPEIVCSFEDGNLYIILPSGRSLTYPNARLVPGKFEGTIDLAYFDNSKKQWREIHEWYGIDRRERGVAGSRAISWRRRSSASKLAGCRWCFTGTTTCVCEVPEGAITDAEFLAILLEAAGLGRQDCRSPAAFTAEPHYLPASDEPAAKAPPVETSPDRRTPSCGRDPVEQAIDALVAEPAAVAYTPAELRTFERNDAQDELDNLEEHAAPLYEIAELAITTGAAKVICPFHDDSDPSCHALRRPFLLFRLRRPRLPHGLAGRGRGHDPGRGGQAASSSGTASAALAPVDDQKTANSKRALALWNGGKPIAGTLAERYLAETRKIAVERLPDAIADSLRFYDQCPYGKGVKHPCLIALMTAPDGTPCGIHRIALAEVDGKVDKIGRMALGAMGTVRLWPANGRLVVGEGIETMLAAATRIPYRGAAADPGVGGGQRRRDQGAAGDRRRVRADPAGRPRPQRRRPGRRHGLRAALAPGRPRGAAADAERAGLGFQRRDNAEAT